MKLYFSFGFGICTKLYIRFGFNSIPHRVNMVSQMQRFLRTTHSTYIDDFDKYKIYTFKNLGDRI